MLYAHTTLSQAGAVLDRVKAYDRDIKLRGILHDLKTFMIQSDNGEFKSSLFLTLCDL